MGASQLHTPSVALWRFFVGWISHLLPPGEGGNEGSSAGCFHAASQADAGAAGPLPEGEGLWEFAAWIFEVFFPWRRAGAQQPGLRCRRPARFAAATDRPRTWPPRCSSASQKSGSCAARAPSARLVARCHGPCADASGCKLRPVNSMAVSWRVPHSASPVVGMIVFLLQNPQLNRVRPWFSTNAPPDGVQRRALRAPRPAPSHRRGPDLHR